MARSKGVTVAVKVPIKWEVMTGRTRQRLRQIVGRDTRVVRAYLGIIEQYEDDLLTGKDRTRLDEGRLDRLTMTALKVKAGCERRVTVPHDFKARFPRASPNEIAECRKTAVALYESYLKLRAKKGRDASRPKSVNTSGRIPRWIYAQRFKLVERKTVVARWWVDLRDSLDSSLEGRAVHDRLNIPLKISPFHEEQIQRGKVKALQIFTDRSGKWWATFAVRIPTNGIQENDLPVAILGIDLGIRKAVCTSLLTPEKTRESRFFVQREKVSRISRYDDLVATLQHEMHTRKNKGIAYDHVAKKLRAIRFKRENISREYDRVLVRQLINYITDLSQKYTLYIAIGRLKNITMRARRGTNKGIRFRAMVNSWSFARITQSLKHGLAQIGWVVDGKEPRFRVVPEAWTSIICWKCGIKGRRPMQDYFHCPSCGQKTNADRNGSVNIAARMLTLTKSLHSVGGLGLWARALDRARRARPKAQRKSSSKGKSLLLAKGSASEPGESAVAHFAQTSLTSFSDGVGESEDDPAVGRTVETLAVAGSDAPAIGQEEEARSGGGIPSR